LCESLRRADSVFWFGAKNTAHSRQTRLSEEAMKNLALKVQRFLVSEDGPTAVEYAVMLALIIIVCLTAIQAIGTNANATFNSVAAKLPSGGGT
jgi:pilus assembly protein Flp/PilA